MFWRSFSLKGKRNMVSTSKVAKNIMLEIIVLLIVVIAFTIFSVIMYKPVTEINTAIQEDVNFAEEGKNMTQKFTDNYPSLYDGLIITLFVLFWLAVILSAFYIDSHPAFFVISLILLIFTLLTVTFLGNSMVEILQDEEVGGSNFPATLWLFNHLLLVSLVVGISVLGVIYAKSMAD
jgi:hypothetical protein